MKLTTRDLEIINNCLEFLIDAGLMEDKYYEICRLNRTICNYLYEDSINWNLGRSEDEEENYG